MEFYKDRNNKIYLLLRSAYIYGKKQSVNYITLFDVKAGKIYNLRQNSGFGKDFKIFKPSFIKKWFYFLKYYLGATK